MRVLVDQAGGPSAFARKLGIRDTGLQDYLRGKSLPGNKLRQRLRDAGYDDQRVMSGSPEAANANHLRVLEAESRQHWPVEWAMIDLLKSQGIDTRERLDGILKHWRESIKMVAETVATKATYRVRKK